MHKAVILLTRRADMSRDAFRDWWLNEHRSLAEGLPGLRRHAFNLLPEGAPYDAVVEQWFETLTDLQTCYQTPHGQAVVADSAANISARVRLLAEEHTFDIATRARR